MQPSIEILIERYLTGVLNDADRNTLNRWIEQNAQQANDFTRHCLLDQDLQDYFHAMHAPAGLNGHDLTEPNDAPSRVRALLDEPDPESAA